MTVLDFNAAGMAVAGEAAATIPLRAEARPLEMLGPLWRELEAQGVATPYQTRHWIRCWCETLASPLRIQPMPVVLTDAGGRTVGLLPLGVSKRHGLRVAGFLGGKHANFNMGLFDRGAAAALQPDDLLAALRALAKRHHIDLFRFQHQPYAWEGFANPLAALPRRPSANSGWKSAPLMIDGEALARSLMSNESLKKARRKERKLAEEGALAYVEAADAAEADAILDAFFRQKAERFAAQGIADPFADPAVQAFLRAAARPREDGAALSLHALRVGERYAAVLGAALQGGRASAMFISFDAALGRHSPGDVLLLNSVLRFGAMGLSTFDLGTGDGAYKRDYCPIEEPLFDSLLPMTAKGWLAAKAMAAGLEAKGFVKRDPRAMRLLAALRRLRR